MLCFETRPALEKSLEMIDSPYKYFGNLVTGERRFVFRDSELRFQALQN